MPATKKAPAKKAAAKKTTATTVNNTTVNTCCDDGCDDCDDLPFEVDKDIVMWAMWVICILAFFVTIAAVLWHVGDDTTKTNIEKQRTSQEIARQWQKVADACRVDEQPRICIERAQGTGRGQ